MSSKLTVGSLFSGIGGFELGLEQTGGFRTIWQVEIDPFCRRILANHWPEAERYPDVRAANWSQLQHPDVLCGGFPCQDIASVNRQGEGIEGGQSSLWSEFVEAICEIGPRWVLAENVESLRWAGRGLGTVHRDLAEAGYHSESYSIPAGMVGANHRRGRIFIVAYPVGEPGLQTDPGTQPLREKWQSWRSSGRLDWSEASRSAEKLHSSHVVGADDGVSGRVDRSKTLGNAIVPQVAEFLGEQVLQAQEAGR